MTMDYCGVCKTKHFNNVNSIQRTRRATVFLLHPSVRLLEFCSWICFLVNVKILEPPWKSGPAKTGPARPVPQPLWYYYDHLPHKILHVEIKTHNSESRS